MLKLRCCVFDALIKKSHFICIINATEMKRREGKTALNVQRNTKSLYSFLFWLAASSGEMAKMYLPCLRMGCHGRRRGLFEQKLWKHTV